MRIGPSSPLAPRPGHSYNDIGAYEYAHMRILNISRPNYQVGFFNEGKHVYTDDPMKYESSNIPSFDETSKSLCIQTPYADKHSTGSAFLSFTTDKKATVYVAMDAYITDHPSWLSSWKAENLTMTTGIINIPRKIYSKQFPAGKITLGGNVKNASQNAAMYSIILVPDALLSSTASNWIDYK